MISAWFLMLPTLALTHDEVAALLTAIIGLIGVVVTGIILGIIAFMKLHSQFRPNHGSSARDQWDRIETRQDAMQNMQQQIIETNARQDRDIAGLRDAMTTGARHITEQVVAVRQDIKGE